MSLCLSALLQSHILIDFHEKNVTKAKNLKIRTSSLGSRLDHPFRIMAQNSLKRIANFFQPNHQRRKMAMSRSHHTGLLRHWHGRHSLSRGLRVSLKLQNNKSKMADGRHLANTQTGAILQIHKQVYLSHFFADLHEMWPTDRYWPYEG